MSTGTPHWKHYSWGQQKPANGVVPGVVFARWSIFGSEPRESPDEQGHLLRFIGIVGNMQHRFWAQELGKQRS